MCDGLIRDPGDILKTPIIDANDNARYKLYAAILVAHHSPFTKVVYSVSEFKRSYCDTDVVYMSKGDHAHIINVDANLITRLNRVYRKAVDKHINVLLRYAIFGDFMAYPIKFTHLRWLVTKNFIDVIGNPLTTSFSRYYSFFYEDATYNSLGLVRDCSFMNGGRFFIMMPPIPAFAAIMYERIVNALIPSNPVTFALLLPRTWHNKKIEFACRMRLATCDRFFISISSPIIIRIGKLSVLCDWYILQTSAGRSDFVANRK